MAKSPEKPPFQRLLDAAELKLGGQKKSVASAIGITASRYSKLYSGEDYSLSITNCLRLARAIERPASQVLRSFGKDDVAELLDELYGATPTTGPDREVVAAAAAELLERLDSMRVIVAHLAEQLPDAGAPRSRARTAGARPGSKSGGHV